MQHGEKHDELEICVQLQSWNLAGNTETWMEYCHEGMRVFGKDRMGS